MCFYFKKMNMQVMLAKNVVATTSTLINVISLVFFHNGYIKTFTNKKDDLNIYIILIARVRVQYGKIFYEHAKYFHEPKASENVA